MSTASGDEYLVADPTALVGERRVSGASGRQWPFAIIAAVVVTSAVLLVFGRFGLGMQGLVVAMATAAVLRLLLPTHVAGWLANRSRLVDASCFAGLALGLAGTLLLLA